MKTSLELLILHRLWEVSRNVFKTMLRHSQSYNVFVFLNTLGQFAETAN